MPKLSPTKHPEPRATSIMLIDEQQIVLEGLRRVLERLPGTSVCAVATNRQEATDALTETRPDIVVTELLLSGVVDFELLTSLARGPGEPAVLVLSSCDEVVFAERALRAGARGYVMKTAAVEVVLAAVGRVRDASVYLSNEMTTRLVEKAARGFGATNGNPTDILTDREVQVLELIGAGRTTSEAGQVLRVSVKTVETHRASLKRKLGLKTGPELMRFAVGWSLTRDGKR